MARNNSVEIYRVGLMAGICLLHSMGFGMRQNVFAMNILSSCVVGFAFISGWFGIRFSWLKLAKLYGIGVYAAAIFGMASLTIGDASDIVSAAVMAFNKLVKGFWFLHAYAVMMIMSPMINALLEKAERRGEERRGEGKYIILAAFADRSAGSSSFLSCLGMGIWQNAAENRQSVA